MQVQAIPDEAAAEGRDRRAQPARRILIAASAVATATGVVVSARSSIAGLDPDLVRVLRFMAAMKGLFAVVALAAGYWRLARPAAPWRTAIYVVGPPLMIVGAFGLWALRDPGLAALGLHLGLLSVLAAALTDPGFLPTRTLRYGRPR